MLTHSKEFEGVRIVRHMMRHQARNVARWVCVLTVICSQFGLFTLRAAAQEPTTEPTSLPTPTPAPTWTATPTPTNTPDPAVTPTANATAAARVVDFRVDEDEITQGECVMFSWVVRGDIDRVEFDQIGDGKVPILVSDMDSREECPEEDTKYELTVTWLDSTQTTPTIKIDVGTDGSSSSGDNSTGNATPTPGGTAAFVPVTPIPIVTTPVSVGYSTPVPVSSGGAVVTPVGVLASVQMLPETGYMSASPHDETDVIHDGLPNRGSWWMLAGTLAIVLAVVVIGWAIGTRIFRTSEVPR